MKKLFTLLTMLLVGIGSSWGDDFTPDANAEYTLQCCATDHSGFIGLNNGALDGRSAIGTRFKFESATGGYYIKVVDANKYFNWNNEDAELGANPQTVWEVTSSQYISGKYRIAPSGTASDKGLNNNETSKVTHLKIGPFERASNTCSHWTIRAITIPSNCNAYIGGVTTGNYTIDETKWKTQGNWALNDNWNNYGPGCSVSGSAQGMWSPIYLKDIKGGTVPALDGWNFRMIADHSTYEIAKVGKIQPECYLTLKNTSVVTMNFGTGHTFSFTVNLDEGTGNTLNFSMSNGYNHYNPQTCSNECNGQITVNYGSVSKNTGREFNASGSGSIKKLILNATLTEPTENNTVEEIPLVTYTSGVSSTTVTYNISGDDGWTEVGSEAELSTQFINGKYYYVEDTATGVKLHTYKETTKIGYTVAENSTVTLSQIDNYENYDSYTVPSNSTLIIDIDDFNLKRIYGTGNINIASGKTLVVNVVGFDLTRITGEGNVTLDVNASLADGKHTSATGTLTVNEGKTLSMGSSESTDASVKSFSNVILKGILHYNTQKNEIKNLTIPENETGVIFSDDMGDENSGNKISLTGTTTINSGANLITCNHWNFKLEISKLTGSGTWEICGTGNSSYSYEHQSTERSLNIVNDASEFTGTINLNNDPSKDGDNSTVTVEGNLVGCTLKKTTGDYFYYSGANLNGTTLEGVILNGNSAVTVSGDATLNFTATTALNNSFIINSGKTLTINGGSNTINFTGTVSGGGNIVLDYFPTAATHPTLTDWTGSIEFPSPTSGQADLAAIFNAWGNTNSTIKLHSVTGWLPGGDVNPTLNILESETLTINNGSSSTTPVLTKITGAGILEQTWNASAGTYALHIGTLTGFTGTLKGTNKPIVVEKLVWPDSNPPFTNTRLIKTSDNVTLLHLYLGLRETNAYEWETKTVDNINGIYVTTLDQVELYRDMAVISVMPYFNHIGTGVGKYTISLGIDKKYTSISEFTDAIEAWSKLSDCSTPIVTINQPTSAFYRIKAGDKYLQDARKSDSETQRTLTDAVGANESAETIFYLDNNKFIGYKTGYGFGFSVCQTQDTEHLNTQLFTESAEIGKYTIQSQQGTCTSADDNQGYWGVDGSDLSREDDAASGACWTLEPATSVPVTFNSTALGYATFNSPVALIVPKDEVKAYVCKIEGNTIKMYYADQLKDGDNWVLPENTPVLLYNSDYTNTPTVNLTITSDTDEEYENNGFNKGTVAAETPDADNYIYYALRKLKSGTVGFYQRADQTAALTGFRAWIAVPKTSGARNFTIEFDGDSDPTGIVEALGLKDANVEIYDLNGRKLSEYRKGINIVNGKKVFK